MLDDPRNMNEENTEQNIVRVREMLLFRRYLVETGMSDRKIEAAVGSGRMVRLVPGAFVLREAWGILRSEERLLARTLAVAHLNRRRTVVFSHHSAAAIWGLPLWSQRDQSVSVLTPIKSPSRRSGSVRRHIDAWGDADICEVAGLQVTTLSKTIVDLARYASPELSIGVADAGLRRMFGFGRNKIVSESSELYEWRGSQLERLEAMRGERGVRRARRQVVLADPRADSVVESVSRLQFSRLQMEVEIQVPVRGSAGQQYWLDFEFLGQRAFGEVDGAVKYADARMLGGGNAHEAVVREKRREDEVRGVENKRIVRWMPESIATPELLGRRMRAFGLRVPSME